MNDNRNDVNRTAWGGVLAVILIIVVGAVIYRLSVPNPDLTSAGEVPRVRQ